MKAKRKKKPPVVYVDELQDYTQCEYLPPYLRKWWCHMTCDSLEELHKMADKIGLKRAWFQDKAYYPHYDLQPSKRKLAIENGAVETACIDRVRQMRKINESKKKETA